MKQKLRMIPAIDLMDGKCVRLVQGKKDTRIVYSDDPTAMARSFEESGAERLHIVDLDGAFEGSPKNLGIIESIRKTTGMIIEVGGGIRSEDNIRAYLEMGINHVILGTRAIQEPDWLAEQIREWRNGLIIGLDAKDGMLASQGWTVTEKVSAADFALELEAMGVSSVIYTDVSRDGMLTGPNLAALSTLANTVRMNVIASGGIHTIEDVRNIRNLRISNVTGIITGKALYEKTLDLKEAIALLKAKF